MPRTGSLRTLLVADLTLLAAAAAVALAGGPLPLGVAGQDPTVQPPTPSAAVAPASDVVPAADPRTSVVIGSFDVAPPATTVPATTAPAPTAPASATPTATPTGAAPAPAPPETAPTPPAPPAPVPAASRRDRVEDALRGAVPPAWLAATSPRIEIIPGATSFAHGDGLIEVGTTHADGSDAHLADVLAHEVGHLVAFGWGTQRFAGAAPEGWPAPAGSADPAEAWADCVQLVFTGRVNPSHGLAPCPEDARRWTETWLAAGPDAHGRTR